MLCSTAGDTISRVARTVQARLDERARALRDDREVRLPADEAREEEPAARLQVDRDRPPADEGGAGERERGLAALIEPEPRPRRLVGNDERIPARPEPRDA